MRSLFPVLYAAFFPLTLFPQPNFWEQTSGPYGFRIQALAVNSSGYLFAGTSGGGIFRSTDKGENWAPINFGLANNFIYSLAINSNDDIFAQVANSGIFRSTNHGESWVPVNNGLVNSHLFISFAIDSSGHILAGTQWGRVFRSTDNGDNWVQVGQINNRYVDFLAIGPDGHIFAATDISRMAGFTQGSIFRSVDRGEKWTRVYTDTLLPSSAVGSLIINARGHVFAVTTIGIIRSVDDGESWSTVNAEFWSTMPFPGTARTSAAPR